MPTLTWVTVKMSNYSTPVRIALLNSMLLEYDTVTSDEPPNSLIHALATRHKAT